MAHEELAAAVLGGETRAAARACRVVDEAWPGHHELLAQLYTRAEQAWFVGITGSPGVGKSTLTSRLLEQLRKRGERAAVVAVDPSSPFSGGALLGDRIRMQAHWDDPDVFIRSLATRGAMGGLSRTTADVARVLGAWGARVVLIETVGVGQDELDIMRVAHTTLVVQAPGAGDEIQAAKAGLLECADVFAVNKSDLPGAAAVVQQLRAMLELGHITASRGVASSSGRAHGPRIAATFPTPALASTETADAAEPDWDVGVVSCVASRGEYSAELLAELERHRAWLEGTAAGRQRRSQRLREELVQRLGVGLSEAILERHADELGDWAERVAQGKSDPYSATEALIARWTQPSGP